MSVLPWQFGCSRRLQAEDPPGVNSVVSLASYSPIVCPTGSHHPDSVDRGQRQSRVAHQRRRDDHLSVRFVSPRRQQGHPRVQAGQEEPTPTQRSGLKRQRPYGNTTNIIFGDLQDLSLYLLLDVFLLHLSLCLLQQVVKYVIQILYLLNNPNPY